MKSYMKPLHVLVAAVRVAVGGRSGAVIVAPAAVTSTLAMEARCFVRHRAEK